MSTEIAYLTATELLARYRAGTLSPVEATRAALERIAALNPRLNAFNLVDAEGALRAAGDSEARWRRGAPAGLLDGVPTSIKDVILTRGWPTLRGSRAVDPNQPWDEDAPATARLRAHGAVLLGKTTTPEFGWKGVGDSPLTGITRNPWNPDTTPGGSSAGSAVQVACGMGPLTIGTDGGGSVRIPAAFTGIVALKPTFGRVPAYPSSPFGTLAHVGPMTWTVADAALMLTVLAQPDPRDWYQLPPGAGDFRDGLDAGVRGLRVVYSPDLGYARVDPEVATLVRRAAAAFEALGATVEERRHLFDDPTPTFQCHWYAGAAKLAAGFSPAQMARLDPGLLEVIEAGRRYSAVDYLQAVERREALGRTMNLLHAGGVDLILTPTLPIPAFAAGAEVPPGSGMARWTAWTPFTYPFNLTGQPAASVPCGFTQGGLPVGLQIVGARYADALVLRAAHAYQTAHPLTDRRPAL